MHTLLKVLLWLSEPLLLGAMVFAFWHHSPPIRDAWVGLLLAALPIFGLRWLIYGRFFTLSPIIVLGVPFILLTFYNYNAAPYARNDYWVLVCRPLLGLWLVIYCVEHVRMFGTMRALLWASVGTALTLGVLGLTATQWSMDKSAIFTPLIEQLPRFDYRTVLPDSFMSFNPNEIAGALAWLCPLAFGLLYYKTGGRALRIVAGLAFGVQFLALLIGQSRAALAGVLGVLLMMAWWIVGKYRVWVIFAISLVIVFEILLVFGMLSVTEDGSSTPGVSTRDESSWSTRFEIWESGLLMLRDYPITGAGMSMYRRAVYDAPYRIPSYADRNYSAPHAHNEWLQIGTDLGVPGLLIFIAWQGAAGFMLWRARETQRVVVVAIAGGLVAHAVYGLGDAVTLWDRYAFLFWWLLGLTSATYHISQVSKR